LIRAVATLRHEEATASEGWKGNGRRQRRKGEGRERERRGRGEGKGRIASSLFKFWLRAW